jgi:hypothetical protein
MIICQDRLGTNIGKALKKSGVFWQLVDMLDPEKWPRVTGKKSHLLCHFILKNDRFTKTGSGQTWGKLKKRCVFYSDADGWVSQNGLFEPFIHNDEHFTKTGSGQT